MNSEVKANRKALTRIEISLNAFRMRYQTPISSACVKSGLLNWETKLNAPARIRMTEVKRAKKGPSGKAATNIVANPYCRTVKERVSAKIRETKWVSN